jgi:hypothetical protein
MPGEVRGQEVFHVRHNRALRYAHEFPTYREKKPAPYIDSLRFKPAGNADPYKSLLSEEQIKAAIEKGKDKNR